MKPSIEFLFHCHCDHCQLWWTIADRINFERLYCPHCGKSNTVELPLNHGIGGGAAFPVAYQLKLGQVIEQLIAELKGGSPLEPMPKPAINSLVEGIGQDSEWYSRGLGGGDRTND